MPYRQGYSKLFTVPFIFRGLSMEQNKEEWNKESDYS